MASLNGFFMDAVVVKGTKRTFSVSINHLKENSLTEFEPLDLDSYSVRFKVLGSATADGEVLLSKIITQNTDVDEVGLIDVPDNGQFTFTITAEDTQQLGLGKFPIMLELLDVNTLEPLVTLTEGGYKGEFNKLQIVQV